MVATMVTNHEPIVTAELDLHSNKWFTSHIPINLTYASGIFQIGSQTDAWDFVAEKDSRSSVEN